MPYLDVDSVRYYYELSGAGDDTLVLLHGFTGSSQNWQDIRAQLHEQVPYMRVLTIDLLGHGHTQSPGNPERYAIQGASADILEILHKLSLSDVHLLGYSMGGRLALYFAASRRQLVKSLILESASPGLETEAECEARRQSDDALADRIEREGITAFVNFWENIPLFASQKNLSADVREAHRQQRLQNNPAGLANSLRGMGTGQQPSNWGLLPELKFPTLLVAGQLDDKYVRINQHMADLIPNAHFEIVPDAGHTVHLEQPDVFTRTVSGFLRSLDVNKPRP